MYLCSGQAKLVCEQIRKKKGKYGKCVQDLMHVSVVVQVLPGPVSWFPHDEVLDERQQANRTRKPKSCNK